MNDMTQNHDCLPGVGCDAYHCKYNEVSNARCTANHIDVQNKAALNKAETFCNTFAPKASVPDSSL